MHPQQQPLDLGTYREDSPIPLISSARLSGSSGDVKKSSGRAPDVPIIPSFGGTMMSVAALVDAANAAAASGKPADPAAFVLGLRPPSVTPPLMKMDPALQIPVNPLIKVESNERLSPPASAPHLEPETLEARKDPSPGPTPPAPSVAHPALPALPVEPVQVKTEPAPPTSAPTPTTNNNGTSKPVHKLKTAWLQRHTGRYPPDPSAGSITIDYG